MNIKQILTIAFLSTFVVGGAGRAGISLLDEEHDAYNLVTHLFGGAVNSTIRGWLITYCNANPCDTDIWSDNSASNFPFPKGLSSQTKADLIVVLKAVLTSNQAMKEDFPKLGYCQNGYVESGRSVTISPKVFGAVCAELGYSAGGVSWETYDFVSAIWGDPKLSPLVESNCKSYCSADKSSADKSLCAGGNGTLPKTWAGAQCIYDAFKANPDVSFPFLLKHQDVLLPYGGTPVVPIPVVGAVCEKYCTKSACNLNYKQNDCMGLCCEISHGAGATTDYLKDCESLDPGPPTNLCKNYLQIQQWQHSTQGNHQSKANAVMAPHPLVIRQNNKALRGNAPQTIRERGTNQNRQSPNNLQTGQPRVMPPLNQGKLPQRKTQHPGMMHVDPHHQGMLPPVNQGRNAPSVNTQRNHPGMQPVENRGRTTPPKMRPMPSGSNSSQHMQPNSGGRNMQNHPGMMPVPHQGQSAPSQNMQQSQNHGLMRPLPPHLVEIERPTQPER